VIKMGLQIYPVTFKFNGTEKTVGIKAKKEMAEAIKERLMRPLRLHRYHREITGVVDGEQHSSVLMSLFGPDKPLTNEPGYLVAMKAYIDTLPEVITEENVKPYLINAAEICQKHMPVVDARETKEDRVVRQAAAVVAEHERALEAQAWRERWCKPGEVAIPEGMMAVYLEINFNDSNTMVDYFDHHHGVGANMLLAIVPKQAEREALARRVLESYPELAKLKWEWHTEKYSMGHGNYLESEVFGTEKHHAYDGREEVQVWYEVQFSAGSRAMLAYKDYPGIEPATAAPVRSGDNVNLKVDNITIRKNEEHNGIEVIFPAKPEASVIATLKSLGFRWSPRGGLWYTKYSDDKMQQVRQKLEPLQEAPKLDKS
jgi:hypothetical protein